MNNGGEVELCRKRLAKFCVGCGVDLGPGGNPILPTSLRIDLKEPYTTIGGHPTQFPGDARDLYWFRDDVLDYVFSSHLLEDFKDTESVLREWLRVLRVGGYLVLCCPVERVFREHCKKTGQPVNDAHAHADFDIEFVERVLTTIDRTRTVYRVSLISTYSFELVARKVK